MGVRGFQVNGTIQKYEYSALEGIPEFVGGGGQPVTVTEASKMTNHDLLYLYLGEESGYEYGYIYAYLNGGWEQTDVYGKGEKGDPGESPDDIIAIQENQPTSDTNVIWVKPSGTSEVIQVITVDDYNPVAKTSGMTQAVGVDSDGKLWTAPGGGTGGGIPAPANPATGAFLVYDGTAWVAQTLTTWQGGSY